MGIDGAMIDQNKKTFLEMQRIWSSHFTAIFGIFPRQLCYLSKTTFSCQKCDYEAAHPFSLYQNKIDKGSHNSVLNYSNATLPKNLPVVSPSISSASAAAQRALKAATSNGGACSRIEEDHFLRQAIFDFYFCFSSYHSTQVCSIVVVFS